MDAHNYGTVAKWLAVFVLTVCLLASLPAVNAETEPVSPIPTDWIQSPNSCGGMIPNMLPAECHSDHRDYYVFFPTITRGE